MAAHPHAVGICECEKSVGMVENEFVGFGSQIDPFQAPLANHQLTVAEDRPTVLLIVPEQVDPDGSAERYRSASTFLRTRLCESWRRSRVQSRAQSSQDELPSVQRQSPSQRTISIRTTRSMK
jgi:hypothetical protein